MTMIIYKISFQCFLQTDLYVMFPDSIATESPPVILFPSTYLIWHTASQSHPSISHGVLISSILSAMARRCLEPSKRFPLMSVFSPKQNTSMFLSSQTSHKVITSSLDRNWHSSTNSTPKSRFDSSVFRS